MSLGKLSYPNHQGIKGAWFLDLTFRDMGLEMDINIDIDIDSRIEKNKKKLAHTDTASQTTSSPRLLAQNFSSFSKLLIQALLRLISFHFEVFILLHAFSSSSFLFTHFHFK